MDLEEAWAGIHVVLSSEMPITKQEAQRIGVGWDDDGLENVLLGGEPLPRRTSFGPVRRLAPAEVARLATALGEWTSAEFRDSYDADFLEDNATPPGDWDREDRCAWLVEHFERLRAFFAESAKRGQAVLISIDVD